VDNAELEQRLTVPQGIEAIKSLKAEYCDICDDAHNHDRMVAMFAEDGTWEGKGLWRAQGHADVRKLAKSFADRFSFSQRSGLQPRIVVNGNAAYGRWKFLGRSRSAKGTARSGSRHSTKTTLSRSTMCGHFNTFGLRHGFLRDSEDWPESAAARTRAATRRSTASP
jgi:hypothetical protein